MRTPLSIGELRDLRQRHATMLCDAATCLEIRVSADASTRLAWLEQAQRALTRLKRVERELAEIENRP